MASLKVRNDLGSLLLTLLILWAYMAWFQFMLIWIANMPVDVVWYLPRDQRRLEGGDVGDRRVAFRGSVLSLADAAGQAQQHGRGVDRRPDPVHAACVHVLPDHARPVAPTASASTGWIFSLPIGIGGIWLAYFLWQLQRQPLLAPHDYNRAAALHLRHLDEEEAAREEALAYG